MPQVGEIQQGYVVGYKDYDKYIWLGCIECGKARWVRMLKGQPRSDLCFKCSHSLGRYAWKGGRLKHTDGYILIYAPDHPSSNIQGYIFGHRLAMEEKLGRYLLSNEHCHHINGIKDCNEPDNLILYTSEAEHKKYHNN